MACATCSNNGSGTPTGCGNKGHCASGGCGKMGVFNWLENMQLPSGQKVFDGVEVRFKNGRKGIFKNHTNLSLYTGDVVVVESTHGYDVGVVILTGELVKLQIERKNVNFESSDTRKIYRKAKPEDIEKWKEARALEEPTMHRARTLALSHRLEMKISDVEYQGDKSKATFYYTAEERVDFRELIKTMADEFKIRIEMRQIGARQEAGRLGGIGSCGRELCCATWLSDFRTVSTSAARYQQLSLNPQKLAGQCGKLKCCLNYELDMYVEAYKSLPEQNVRLQTKKGTAVHFKTDIFKKKVWYIYTGENAGAPIMIDADRAKYIIEQNRKGVFPDDLVDFAKEEANKPVVKKIDYDNVVGQDSITRFDDKNKGKRHGKNRNKHRNQQGKPQNQQGGNQQQHNKPQNNQGGGGQQNQNRNQQHKQQGGGQQNPNRQQQHKHHNKGQNNQGNNHSKNNGGQPNEKKP